MPSSHTFFKRSSLIPALAFLFMLQATTAVFSQVVTITNTENFILMEQVTYLIDGQALIQNSPEGNQNPSPEDVPIIISGIQIEGGKVIYATTRNPSVANPNPTIGSNEIRPDAIQIVRSDNAIISHRALEFFNNLEAVVSTPDIRSYWDINSQPSIPRGEPFVDLIYSDPVVTSGYLLYTERDGNSPTDFIALGKNGEPIEGANTIEVRGYQWKTGIHHVSNVPEQSQEMVLFSPSLFESGEPIFGIRIIAVNEPDGKLIFFVNAISATPDMAERVNSELGGDAVLNIFDNDELNGAALNPIDIQLTILEDFPAGTATLNPDGTVDVPPNTPPGVYTLTYEISAGQDSDQAEVRIEVIEYKPEAFDDAMEVPDSFSRDSVLNVLGNDMLNGLPALIENVNLSEISNNSGGFVSLTADGSIDIGEGIPAGNYLLVYQICDAADPEKCDQATIAITVAQTLLTAVDDTYGIINLNRGGVVGNVLDNDLLNGEAAPTGRVSVTLLDADGLSGVTLSPAGELELPVGLPNGEYELQYEMQEVINPGNRDQAFIRFSLRDIQLEANDDEYIINQNQELTLDLLANDFINTGELLVETLVIIEEPENGTLLPNGDGTLTYTPTANFFGSDSFTYEICENADRQFCDQALVSITVRPIVLELTKTPNLTALPMGGMVTYTILLTNNSEFDLENVLVEEVLPDGLMLLSSNPEPVEGSQWAIETIPAGTETQIEIEAMGVGLGQQVNIANISIGDYINLVQAVPVTVLARPVDIRVEKTSFGIDLYEGNEFEYEIRVSNNGTGPGENIFLEDQLPAGLVYLGFTGEAELNVSGSTLSWTIPSLAAGEERVFRIRVQATETGTITNTIRVQLPEDQENVSPVQEDSDTNQVNPFFIPNVITPGNLDGKNDSFEIRGVERFAQSSLTVLNRNGDHVFASDDYQNDWAAAGLNGGSYFYVLVITDSQGESQTYKGWVQVVK
ncbi:Ig-like domain-containing protein [Cyclobacterium jeungdonense]|uniref:Gliding motility-associated C-terminal domain-containing protein n=1 Tax=Cyclobacterium jeungdonense TaxID=708087 RepID=A0ABT8CD73_9BACT|nr:gliding motility-associated C-terminal domain-containing protein [Cyclobacterium jeungdonense]MDN3689700.1 gliding motility-associated C-terminal domain-containing protein [Cyclobacterium jeungdonense]